MPVALPLAIVGSAAVGAVVSSKASSKAAKTAQETADKNNALQQQIYSGNREALSPYMEAGKPATSAIQALLGLSGTGQEAIANQNAAFQNFRNSTGYQDQFAEGQRAVTGALGNRGLLDSGAAQKALTKYGQGQANQSFGGYYNMLAGQQGVGLTASSALAGVGQNYANAVSNNNNNAAEVRSNATLANAGIINGLIQSGLSAYGLYKGMGSSYGGGGFGGGNYPGTPPFNPNAGGYGWGNG